MGVALSVLVVLLTALTAASKTKKTALSPPPPVEVVAPLVVEPPAPVVVVVADDSATRKTPLRIAVYRLESADIDERVVRITEASLLEEIRKLQRVSVLSLDEVQALLDL